MGKNDLRHKMFKFPNQVPISKPLTDYTVTVDNLGQVEEEEVYQEVRKGQVCSQHPWSEDKRKTTSAPLQEATGAM